jgi:hypothetical protein
MCCPASQEEVRAALERREGGLGLRDLIAKALGRQPHEQRAADHALSPNPTQQRPG